MNNQNLTIAQQFLEKLGSGAPPLEIAAMMSEDVRFEIPGDTSALPWIGEKVGRQAVVDFLRDSREMLVLRSFTVHEILASATRAVIVGELSSTLKRNGKDFQTSFAIILTITDAMVTRYQMFEDSYAVSQSAH